MKEKGQPVSGGNGDLHDPAPSQRFSRPRALGRPTSRSATRRTNPDAVLGRDSLSSGHPESIAFPRDPGSSPGPKPAAGHVNTDLVLRTSGRSWFWLVLTVGAILYGSLIPFDINSALLHGSNLFGLRAIGSHGSGVEDLLTNLFVYLPFGVLVVLCGRRKRFGSLSRIPWAIMLGACVSILAESLQTAVPLRVASWVDVGADVMGVSLGAIMAAAWLGMSPSYLARLRTTMKTNPWHVMLVALSLALLLYHLVPFDFVRTPADLRAAFLRARFDWTTLEGGTRTGSFLLSLSHQLAGAAWFGVLAYLGVLAARVGGEKRGRAMTSAVMHAVTLVVVTELLQLFTRSRVFDLSTIMIRCAAVLGGAIAAIALTDRSRNPEGQNPATNAVAPPGLLWALLAVQVGIVIASSWGEPRGAGLSLSTLRISWLPFESLWRQPLTGAMETLGSSLVTYGATTATLALLLRRTGITRSWWLAGTVVLLLALAAEGIQAISVTRTGDMTGPILAVASAALTAHLCRAFRRYPSNGVEALPT